MGFNRSPLAFDDIREAFDRAVTSPKGLRISCDTREAAFALRSRFNYFRSLDKRENRTTYPEGHRMHGRSIYDRLICRIPPKGSPEEHVLYIEPRRVDNLKIEEIT